MHSAETRNESELPKNAHWYPNCITLAPPRKVPMVSVVHCVVWVSELAVCSSSLVAIDGRIDARPLVKNGEASISRALSTYSSHVSVRLTVRMKAMATTADRKSTRLNSSHLGISYA